MMLARILALSAFTLGFGTAHGNDLLRLYEIALAQDTVLRSAGYQRDAALEARPQALAQLLPHLMASASGEQERSGSETTNGTTPGCALTNDGLMQRCSGNVHGYGLALSQILWSFEDFYRLKQANLQVASAQATFMSAQQSLLLRVAQAYFGILAASDQLATNRSAHEAFRVLLDQAKGREQTGVGPRSDVEQAQAFYDLTTQNIIDAENELDDARLALTRIVATDIENLAPLRDDIPLASPDPASVEQWVASARADNPDVRAAALNVEAADRAIAAQRGRGLPNVSLVGSSTRTWQDPVLGGDQTFDGVGLSLNWPLFQGGAIASGLRQSRALYRQAQADYETAVRETESHARAAYRGVVTGIDRISAARRAVDSTRAAAEASRRNVEFGTGTEFDLLNAQNNYAFALRSYSQTRYDYLANLLLLERLAGRLTERDLQAIDDLLLAHAAR
jgi:outer membrane protein